MPRRTIAVVDDDRISSFVIQRMFESTECSAHVLCFTNGNALLSYMRNHAEDHEALPDMITMDVYMPMATGWETLQELEILIPLLCKTPLIYMLSSSTDPKDVERATHSNIVEQYIVKPISRDKCSLMLHAYS